MKVFEAKKDFQWKYGENVYGKVTQTKQLLSGDRFVVIDSRLLRAIKKERESIDRIGAITKSEEFYEYQYLIEFPNECIWVNCDEYSAILACSQFKWTKVVTSPGQPIY